MPKIDTYTPLSPEMKFLNKNAQLPHGVKPEHIFKAMAEFTNFLGIINGELKRKKSKQFEYILMPANFSSVVGEYMNSSIPMFCKSVAQNGFHNGHPDIIPKGQFPNDAVQHSQTGIEIKASRYLRGWQGHNPEEVFLMVFCFESSNPNDIPKNIPPKPFRFLKVVAANLLKEDWKFAGRSSTSRRTITAAVTKSGFEKMESNWIYRVDDI